MRTRDKTGLMATWACAITLSTMGDATAAPRPPLVAEDSAELVAFTAHKDLGRYYVRLGTYHHGARSFEAKGKLKGELLLDGASLGEIFPGEVIVLDLQPGQHVVSWLPGSSLDRKFTTPAPLNLDVSAGALGYISLDFYDGSAKASALLGAIGALAFAKFATIPVVLASNESFVGKPIVQRVPK